VPGEEGSWFFSFPPEEDEMHCLTGMANWPQQRVKKYPLLKSSLYNVLSFLFRILTSIFKCLIRFNAKETGDKT